MDSTGCSAVAGRTHIQQQQSAIRGSQQPQASAAPAPAVAAVIVIEQTPSTAGAQLGIQPEPAAHYRQACAFFMLADPQPFPTAWDLVAGCNGALVGFVVVTAGANVLEPWAAIIGGFTGGWIFDAVCVESHARKGRATLASVPRAAWPSVPQKSFRSCRGAQRASPPASCSQVNLCRFSCGSAVRGSSTPPPATAAAATGVPYTPSCVPPPPSSASSSLPLASPAPYGGGAAASSTLP
ncbi:hypothetical protein TSOC_007668 [Tetrabaena socialis]|uniref:Ammonium transporter AmtB-like domain-containing protein n=1 Tax=Tetrabaena socialis TaxID=47790 RepID=A0A2J8A0J5_9CHLO|nr:hypothetical protein TSOC_007668 [Tetrabaena socialis]|eukprot:PNH06008.1 hypothetical protein TSOC_007668 [Tetrabaena socialis]